MNVIKVIGQLFGQYYAGFDSKTAKPVLVKTTIHAIKVDDIQAQIICRQLTLLGFKAEIIVDTQPRSLHYVRP